MIYRYDTVPSTMGVARAHAEEGAPHGSWIVARAQTQGRGRRGRTWVSGRDQGLYATLIWRPAPQGFAHGLTLAVGVAVAQAIDDLLGPEVKARMKWPNDIWLEEKKVAGILVEAVNPEAQTGFLLIGIGVNVSAQEAFIPQSFPSTIAPTSLSEHLARFDTVAMPLLDPQARLARLAESLLTLLVSRLSAAYQAFSKTGFASFHPEFTARDALFGRLVETTRQIPGSTEKMEGKCVGISADGQLLLAAGGQTLKLDAGEVGFVRERGSSAKLPQEEEEK